MPSFAAPLFACALVWSIATWATPVGQYRLILRPETILSSSPKADFSGLVDEQFDLGDPPDGKPTTVWKVDGKHQKEFPFHCVLDLGRELPLARLWIFDTHNVGEVMFQTGAPDAWQDLRPLSTDRYMSWQSVPVDRVSRYLRIELRQPSAIFAEIALDAYSPKGWQARQTGLAAEAEAAMRRETAQAKARAEALRRPLRTLAPFGRLSLVEEVLCADDPGEESPAGASRRATVLGEECRVMPTVAKRGSFLRYRMGRNKLLRPGAAYVLAVEYPEDAPRSMVVINGGNESYRGFHTGRALGDALHAKYVDSLVESLDVPLSGKWEQWTLLFRLHDRFPDKAMHRGGGLRPLAPDDGFDVTLCQFPTRSQPLSQGIAVRTIRLYEVVDPEQLVQPLNLPPPGLPRRRLFWREEMADGVIGDKEPAKRGLDSELEWYGHKAELMRFLGMNTYAKDLLEFGACQHWDPTPHGGNEWVYHDARTKDLWARIVELMGRHGLEILPYYEYSGSKGGKGLGFQRRCQPLARDDAYTHVKWIESANADITDPETYDDFRKILDCTVLRLQDRARFAGIWLRPRSQLPIGFGDATRRRFAEEENQGNAVSRDDLKGSPALYARYLAWWHAKRRAFLIAMRDHLRRNGVADAFVLFTGCPAEPGVGFGAWDARFVTDAPDAWRALLAQPEHFVKDSPMAILTPVEVAAKGLYRRGLLSPGLTWGGWEVQHARPADDPDTYRNVEGVMLSHAFNRLYTVAAPETLDLFRAPAGLTVVRHYALNENMMFDENGQELVGYFIADIERAGPYSMMAEAMAVANGDPTQIGYLTGGNFGRGFPLYVRDFNANFLALPALPSTVLPQAADHPKVVVRAIRTPEHGTYLAIVNTGCHEAVTHVLVPGKGKVVRLASNTELVAGNGRIALRLYPFQLVSLHLAAD